MSKPAALAGSVLGGVVAFWMTRRTLRRSSSSGGLASIGWRSAAGSHTLVAALVGCLLSILYILVVATVGPPVDRQMGPLATAAASNGWPRLLWVILAVVVAPPLEEFLFRGALLEGLSQSLGLRTAALIVTVVFLFSHASEARAYWPAWSGIATVSLATLFFRVRTRSLVPAVSVHAAYNLCIVVATFISVARRG